MPPIAPTPMEELNALARYEGGSSAQFAETVERLQPEMLTKEYVAALVFGPPIAVPGVVGRGKRRLTPWIDDLQRGVRYDIYEQMMLDGQVKACVGLLIAGIIGGGCDILPASKPDDPNYKRDTEVADFVRACLFDHCQTSFLYEFLPDMLKAIAVGNRIAEKVFYPLNESPIRGKLIYKSLKPKHRRTVAFVVDWFNNILGIANTPYGMLTAEDYAVLPKEKFALLIWKPLDSDPRGTSDLRSVYEPWWRKQRLRPQQIRYLDQFASPSLIGILAEATSLRQQIDPKTGQPKIDPVTGKPVYIDRSAEMLAALQQFQASSILVIPHGAEVKVVEAAGDGRAFLIALDADNLEIAKSILFATLATEQGPNQGRAASETHSDVVSVNIDYGIGITEAMIRNDLVTPLVDLNYPPGTPSPQVRMPGANRSDFLAWASAIAKLQMAQYLDPTQYPGLDVMLGLPMRSQEALQEAIKAVSQQRQLAGTQPAPDPNKAANKADA
jgi:hypothetical protein